MRVQLTIAVVNTPKKLGNLLERERRSFVGNRYRIALGFKGVFGAFIEFVECANNIVVYFLTFNRFGERLIIGPGK